MASRKNNPNQLAGFSKENEQEKERQEPDLLLQRHLCT
jgi:hypothetical protein